MVNGEYNDEYDGLVEDEDAIDEPMTTGEVIALLLIGAGGGVAGGLLAAAVVLIWG